MTFLKTWMSRRHVLAATALGSWPLEASADPVSSSLKPTMLPSIRPATPGDLPGIVALLTEDAQERRSLDPLLWRLAADAPARVERAVGATLDRPEATARELWLVAEHLGQIVGVTHAMMIPVPPIFDGAAGPPGLLLDDCFTSAQAPSGTAEALLVATEAALRMAGAPFLIASCPAANPCALSERMLAEAVTLTMAKHRAGAGALSARPAAPGRLECEPQFPNTVPPR